MRRLLPALFAATAALFVCSGCGGGGGGGPTSGTLVYVTDWSSRGRAVTGASQRVALHDLDGVFVASRVLNENGGVQETRFEELPRGTYRLTAELWSGPNASNVRTGELEAVVNVQGTTTFRSAVGEEAASLEVAPPQAQFMVEHSASFTATALNGDGEAVFVEPGSIAWSANGGVATVNQDGLALGTQAGQGSIVATYVPRGLSDAAVVTVTPFVTARSKWTVLVFLNAANDLNEFGDLNFNQMERVAGDPDVRFVVQWKQALLPGVSPTPSFIGTRRYLVSHDETDALRSQLVQDMGDDVDMGSADTLREFIQWGMEHYPADRFVLVVWNHGNGWKRSFALSDPTRGVSYDDETGNSINTWELPAALGNVKLDILAWDASLMQMLEVAHQIRDKAEYIVGSEESPPGAGYPYDTVFQAFVANPDAPTLALAKNFVDATLAVPSYQNQKITQSVLEASKLDQLAGAVGTLGAALRAERAANPAGFAEYIQAARANAQAYSPSSGRVYRDLIDLTVELDKAVAGYSPSASILNANQALRQAAALAIVHEGHNALSPDSRGISIDFSSADRFQAYQSDYELISFAQQTQWDEWLDVAP